MTKYNGRYCRRVSQKIPDWVNEKIKDLSYNEQTGIMVWVSNPDKTSRRLNRPVGTKIKSGGLMIAFRRKGEKVKSIQNHYLAWRLHYGDWPYWEVYHLNGDMCDNRICNLVISKPTNLDWACEQCKNNQDENHKLCSQCGAEYLSHSANQSLKQYRQRQKTRPDYEGIKQKRSKQGKAYLENGGREKRKAYREKNREQFKAWRRKNRQISHNKIVDNLRRRVRYAIETACASKIDRTANLIGCSPIELKKHLESQFQPGMNWENYGNPNGDHTNCWHIDHVIPCSAFDLTDAAQQQTCFHYSNLQPLWGKENMAKSNRLDWSLV